MIIATHKCSKLQVLKYQHACSITTVLIKLFIRTFVSLEIIFQKASNLDHQTQPCRIQHPTKNHNQLVLN